MICRMRGSRSGEQFPPSLIAGRGPVHPRVGAAVALPGRPHLLHSGKEPRRLRRPLMKPLSRAAAAFAFLILAAAGHAGQAKPYAAIDQHALKAPPEAE